jgi:hypothetical protein
MTMQGQGESQPGEGVDALEDLANALMPSEQENEESADADPNASEGEEGEQEESNEASGEEEQAEEPVFTVKVDGKEISLKQSELIELAQKGSDYTNKTMAVAEERKAVEAEKARVAEVRKQHEAVNTEVIGRLQAFRDYVQSTLGDPPSTDLIHTHGAEVYLAQKEQHEHRKGQLQQAEAAIQHQMGEAHRKRQAFLAEQADASIKALKNTLPGWNDNTLPELEKYVADHGLTVENAEAGYVQKGLWELAHKAKAYDAIQAQKAQMKPKQQLTKVAKPQAANPTGKAADRVKREAAFNKNPSVDALAALL